MCQSSITVFEIEHAVCEADLCCVFVKVRAGTAKQDEATRGVNARPGGQRFWGTGVVKRQHSTLRRLRGGCARARVVSRSFPRSACRTWHIVRVVTITRKDQTAACVVS